MTNSPPSREFYRPRIGKAAADGLFIVCRCEPCRRSRIYLTTDLVELYHPDPFLEDLFHGRCPRCRSAGFWRLRERYPSDSDVGKLQVRRLTGMRRTPLWRDKLYSAPVKPDTSST